MMNPRLPFMIAVDGPAGAGKGTLAKHLAEVYDFAYLDTGLLYRAIAYEMLENGDDLADDEQAEAVALALDPSTFKEAALRDEAVGGAASFISVYPRVREALLKFQRDYATTPPESKKGVVMDGRDIGTVIIPEAQAKLFVIADLDVRAHRRLKEMQNRGIVSLYEAIYEEMKLRDSRDRERKVSQLKPADEALLIDTSQLDIDEVFAHAKEFVDARLQIYYDPESKKGNHSSSRDPRDVQP